MKFLVTGGAGFIGSHITERLLKEGHSVRVLDNFSSGKEENLSFVSGHRPSTIDYRLIKGDIRDSATCTRACKNIDYILHQAALRSVPKSMTMPHEYNAVNIDGTLNILEAALKAKVKRVVIASSSSVYGDVSKFPQSETDMPLLISPYALTKLAAEYYSRVFSENYGLETVNLRYFNVFGPRQSLDDEYAVVIPKFIHCMLNNEHPPIHGDGLQSRDFTYIDNVVNANILAATVPAQSSKPTAHSPQLIACKTFCEVFNVAAGDDHSILELVDTLNKIMGKKIKPTHTPPRAGDVKRTCADITKISKILNFKPQVNFEDGLRKTVDWFSKKP
ncbi:MAG: SDR family oxidoreductase [Candidatus Omnitrophota bacterium]